MTMRQMTNGSDTLNVVGHIITRYTVPTYDDGYEFYILADEPDTHTPDPDMVHALVMGRGMGAMAISLSEIEPYVMARTTSCHAILPARGYRWADGVPA